MSRFEKEGGWNRGLPVRSELDKYFNQDYTRYHDLFQEHKTPIFLVTNVRTNPRDYDPLTLNPCLQDINFFKLVDPFTAFQEISMYLGGVLGTGEPEMITISDEDMRDKNMIATLGHYLMLNKQQHGEAKIRR